MKSRREQRRKETVTEIKQIAKRQMAELGATNISLRAIAREMGMSAPALYRYFPNYEALITTLIVEAYDSMAHAIQTAEAMHERADFGGRLMSALRSMRDWAIAHPAEYLLIQGTPIPGYEGPDELTRPAAQRSWHTLFAVLIEAAAAGKLELPTFSAEKLPQYTEMSQLWSTQMGLPISIPLLHSALASAALINGLLLAEVTNRHGNASAETSLVELDLIRQRLGIPQPFDRI